MNFSLNINLISIILLSLSAVTAAIYCIWQWQRTRTLKRHLTQSEHSREYADPLPPVSIIVDACGETDQLERFLPLVLEQDYPQFEVIVIVNGEAESTRDLLSGMKTKYDNLHLSFAPYDLQALSRKKLAVMIGIKAARYDIVLTTCANCRPRNEHWVSTIARNFVDGTDIVLGYSHYRYGRDKHAGRRRRVFDTVSTGTQWLVSAIKGHPYRGTSDNLAYRKQLFFDNRGFARSMDLQWGEDDVFVSEIARPDNTRVEIAADSQVSVYYEDLPRIHRLLKIRRGFTSRRVRRAPFRVQALMSVVWWLSLLSAVAAVALEPLNGIVVLAAVLTVVASWVLMASAVSGACRLLQAPRLRFSAPLLALWRPLSNIVFRIVEGKNNKEQYTSYI